MRKRLVVFLSLALMIVGTSCFQSARVPMSAGAAGSLSPKLTPFAHYEDGLSLFISADSRAAQYIKDEGIFPLGIGLANQSKGPLTIHRESFVLETEDGTKYPLVSYEEFKKNYKRSRTDVRLADTFAESMAQRFVNYRFASWNPFPFSGQTGNANRSLQLGRRGWTRSYLYFPVPETGLHGQSFTLLVNVEETSETLVVRFSVR